MSSDVSSPPDSSSAPNSSSSTNSSFSEIFSQDISRPHTPNQRVAISKPVTPYSIGSAARAAVDDGKLNAPPYLREDYDAYIKDDLDNNRVLLHVEKFLELVFDIPLSYRQGKLQREHVASILADNVFRGLMTEFLVKCAAGAEKPLYEDIASLYNRGLELLDALDPFPKDSDALKLNFSVNDPNKLSDGVFHYGLSPDLKSLLASLGKVAVLDDKINWTNVIKPIEVKAQDTPALCNGEKDPRPLHNGQDPLGKNHPRTQANVSSTQVDAGKATSAARKRERSDSNSDFSAAKVQRQSQQQFSANRDSARPANAAEVNPQVQCGRYAMEQLSNILLRSHAILTLFDKDRFQIHYYDRSAIVLSSIVSLSTREGQELFILMLMGLRRLTSEGLGLRNVLDESQKFYTELGYFQSQISQGSSTDWRRMFHGMTLRVGGESYTLQEILFRQPGIVGRTTCVVAATDSRGTEVAVKISCPVETRQSEVDLIARAREYASRDDGHKWVLKHLPKVFASVDIPPALRSVQRRLCEFLNSTDTKWVGKKTLFYESRILRITVFEKLNPLLKQTNCSMQAQLFFDVLQTHKWLYDHPRILHRDISMSNIMYRVDENGDHFGVPNDLDLASLRTDLDSRIATSTRRTGTPPFMAMDLQDPNIKDVPHLYRHDLESLFYVIVMLVVRHKIVTRGRKQRRVVQLDDNPNLQGWFDAKKSWEELQDTKTSFVMKNPMVLRNMIKPDFNSFEEWVTELQNLFRKGLNARGEASYTNRSRSADPVDPSWLGGKVGYASGPTCQPKAPYSDETLGGFVDYASFFLIMRRFGKHTLTPRYTHEVQP